MKTTTVVPFYNENPDQVAEILANLQNYVDAIVVVDDGSKINQQSAISNQQLSWLRHELNRGQGAALQTGTDYAIKNGAEIIIHFDSDGQHNPEDIPALIKPIQEGRVDFVFGSRYKKTCPERSEAEPREPMPQRSHVNYGEFGSRRDPSTHPENQTGFGRDRFLNIPPTKKYLLHPLARFINYLFTGLKLSDAHNGLRAFRASIADQIYLTQDRMAHATEIMRLVKQNKIRYTEVAVRVNYSQYGQGLKGGVKIVRELLTGKIVK